MKKGVIFIFILLTVIAAEMWALYQHSRHPSPVAYSFDLKEYALPKPDMRGIKPFLFETDWSNKVNDILDKIQGTVENSFQEGFFKSLGNLSEHRRYVAQVKQERADDLEQFRQRAVQENQPIKGEYLGRNRCTVNGVESICEDGIYKLDEHCIACYCGHCTGTRCTAAMKNATKTVPTTSSPEDAADTSKSAKDSAAVSSNLPHHPNTQGKALVAVIIDDVGLSAPFTNQLMRIEKPITAAFLPYGASDKKQVMKLKNAGFEVMLHIPMMPHSKASLAPNTLTPEMPRDEIQQKFIVMLERFSGTGMVGANNHMGSKFTEDNAAMSAIAEILKQKNMFFLDSKTSSKSVAKSACKKYNVPYIARDVFLDNEKDYGKIMRQFALTERIAQKRGYAVAIGHPYPQTLQALRDWEKNLAEHNIEIVPLAYLVQKAN